MILKRNFHPLKVIQYVKTEMMMSAVVSVALFLLHHFGIATLALPFSVAAILGSALAIFIAFRNNTSYGRWWEARTLWGSIINSSRVLARLIITFTDSHAHQPNYDKNRSENFKREMILKTIAWAHALRLHLRKQESWHELKKYVSEEEFNSLNASQNKTNQLHLLMAKQIYDAMANGTLAGFDSFQLEGQLLALANNQGGCERIKNTPLLRQYDFFTRVFLYVFMLLLPLALVSDFAKMNIDFMIIPVSFIICFVFAVMNRVGEINENPFENQISDIPMTALCNTIERDLKEMLGELIPEKLEVENGYLF